MRNRRLSACERSVPRFSKKSLTAGIAFGRCGQKNAAYPPLNVGSNSLFIRWSLTLAMAGFDTKKCEHATKRR